MDVVRKSPDFAGRQISILLADLNNSNNSTRLKAIKRFQDYVLTNKPEVYDDDVDLLFLGSGENSGLLYWSGARSSKHDGQLKRTCLTAIQFLKTLVTIGDASGDVFRERFFSLPVHELLKINFATHITSDHASNIISGQSRYGSSKDAFEIMSLLAREHLDQDGQIDPLDINVLIDNDSTCHQKYMAWLQQSAAEEITNVSNTLRNSMALHNAPSRPTTWAQVKLIPVPILHDEDGFGDEISTEVIDKNLPILDPLCITNTDLRAFQVLQQTNFGHVNNNTTTATTSLASLSRQGLATTPKLGLLQSLRMKYPKGLKMKKNKYFQNHFGNNNIYKEKDKLEINHKNEDMGEDDEDREFAALREQDIGNILPNDKNFSPALFLSVVHSTATFDQLKQSMEHLTSQIIVKQKLRDELVRVHFGLFIKCAEGLDWVKAFRCGIEDNFITHTNKIGRDHNHNHNTNNTTTTTNNNTSSNYIPLFDSRSGEVMLSRVLIDLSKAKELVSTSLGPIVKCMIEARQIKAAEQILKRLSSYLDFPSKIQSHLERREYEDVILTYQRFKAQPILPYRVLHKASEKMEFIMIQLKVIIENILLKANEPNIPNILRAIKLLKSIEEKEKFHETLRKCFKYHLETFSKRIHSLEFWFKEKAEKAYFKGQEINLLTDNSNRLMNRKKLILDTTSNESIRQQSSRNFLITTSNGKLSSSYQQSKLPQFHNDDDDIDIEYSPFSEGVPEEVQYSINGSTSNGQNMINESWDTVTAYTENELLLDDGISMSDYTITTIPPPITSPNNLSGDHVISRCSRVRVAYIRRLVDLVALWLPCLHKLTMTVLAEEDQAGVGSRLGVSRDILQGQPALQLADALVSVAETIQSTVIGFSSGDSTFKGIFQQQVFRETLRETYFRKAVKTVSSFFDILNNLQTLEAPSRQIKSSEFGRSTRNIFMTGGTMDDSNFTINTDFAEVLEILSSLIKEGDLIIVNRFSRKIMTTIDDMAINILTTINTDNNNNISYEEDHKGQINICGKLIDNIEIYLLNALKLLSIRCKRYQNVSEIIWQTIIKIYFKICKYLDNYITNRNISSIDSGLIDTTNSIGNTSGISEINALDTLDNQLKACGVSSRSSSGHLYIDNNNQHHHMNTSGKEKTSSSSIQNSGTSTSGTTVADTIDMPRLLDVVRTCLTLRTSLLLKVFSNLCQFFPQESEKEVLAWNNTSARIGSNNTSMKNLDKFRKIKEIPIRPINPLESKNEKSKGSTSKSSNATSGIDSIKWFDTLMKLAMNSPTMLFNTTDIMSPQYNDFLSSLITSVLGVEQTLIQSYIDRKISSAMVILKTSYIELSTNPMITGSTSSSTSTHGTVRHTNFSDIYILSSRLSRLLLLAIDVKKELQRELGYRSLISLKNMIIDSEVNILIDKYSALVYREICTRILRKFQILMQEKKPVSELDLEELCFLEFAFQSVVNAPYLSTTANTTPTAFLSSSNLKNAATTTNSIQSSNVSLIQRKMRESGKILIVALAWDLNR